LILLLPLEILVASSSSFEPDVILLFGPTRSRDRCWAVVRLSRRPEPSSCAPWGGRWIGQSRTTWSTVCSFATRCGDG